MQTIPIEVVDRVGNVASEVVAAAGLGLEFGA